MTLTRLLPLQFHAVLEALLAPAIVAVPFLLGFDPLAQVGGVLVGAMMMGSAFHVSGRSPRISAHVGLDMLVTTLTGGLALGSALIGDLPAAAFFVAVVAAQLLLAATTRYSGAPR